MKYTPFKNRNKSMEYYKSIRDKGPHREDKNPWIKSKRSNPTSSRDK